MNIVLTAYQRGPDGEFKSTEQRIEIPSALFPELKRTVEALDTVLTAQHLSGDFEEAEEEPKEAKKPVFAHPSEEEFAKILLPNQVVHAAGRLPWWDSDRRRVGLSVLSAAIAFLDRLQALDRRQTVASRCETL